MHQPSRSTIVVGLLVTCISSTATAQSDVTGAITGTLTGPSKKTTQTVDVVARNIDTKRDASATTDDGGHFRIVGLPPGRYIVEVNAPGFNSLAVANAVVEVGRATTVEVSLDSATAHAGFAPTHMPGINTTGQDFSVSLNQTSFNDLPNNGRRWSNFALLAPATAQDGPFGAVSFRGISSSLNKPSFRTISAAGNNVVRERQLQFGIRMEF